MTSTRTHTSRGARWWFAAAAVVLIAAGFYAWRYFTPPEPAPASGAPPSASAERPPDDDVAASPPAPAPAPAAESAAQSAASPAAADAQAPRYPLPAGPSAGDLPAADSSDAVILDALLALARRDVLAQFLNLQELTRRFVITVDHLPREMVPAQMSAVRRIPGALSVDKSSEGMILRADNSARYAAFLRFAESLNPKTLVALYQRFYPLLQQEYRAMGFPNGHFNDRLIDAIDDMLAAPEVLEPIRLVQPKVNYRFADPALESLSAGRKLMLRVGPENAARIRQMLRAIRAELVR
ncbi:MAG: DUF3014 domain-containing protein [Burkholderiaceae bacterium]